MRSNEVLLGALLEHFSADHSAWVDLGLDIGASALCRLMDRLGGTKTHVPTLESFVAQLTREMRDQDIRARFNGLNYDELSSEYGIGPRHIRRIVHGAEKK